MKTWIETERGLNPTANPLMSEYDAGQPKLVAAAIIDATCMRENMLPHLLPAT
jgi:hypothetical protein